MAIMVSEHLVLIARPSGQKGDRYKIGMSGRLGEEDGVMIEDMERWRSGRVKK